MKVGEILHGKARGVLSIGEDNTLREAINILAARKIGLLLVTDGEGRFTGVISERDVMRDLAAKGADAFGTLVRKAMTSDVVVCELGADSHDALVLMGKNKIRHLPVVTDGEPVGVISASDIMRALAETGSAEERVALWTKVAWI